MFVKLEKCGIAFGQQCNKRMKKRLTEKLSYDKESNGLKSFRQNLHVLLAGSGSFLSSLVVFFEQNMLDAEQGIQNYKFRRA